MESKEMCKIPKEDYERIMAQGKKEEMERLLDYAMIKFKEGNVRTGQIKVLEEYATATNYDVEEITKNPTDLFTRRGQVKGYHDSNPFFYDKARIFWLWDKELKKYSRSDETDLLNSIQKELGVETINSKTKTELIEGFKQVGRENIPEPFKKTWVQFKDVVYDWETGESFKVSPKHFSKNTIPWKVGKTEETPHIDKLFEDWVGGEHKQELYEFIAYMLSQEKFMQRLFALCGGGSNGKGSLIKIGYKFLGKDNYVTSELKLLSENIFESAYLYGKLLFVMGEVSYGDLKNTNMIKKLAGEDELSFQFKGKDSFTDKNTAVGVCLTNSLPPTPDKTRGFYRKWAIIDFPNEFQEINQHLIENIPDVEFENLALKSMRILKELSEKRKFTNEGDFEEREKRYEERSNPVIRFLEEKYEESAGESIPLREFSNSCNKFLKIKHLRVLTAVQIGKILREEGFSVGNRKIGDVSSVVILNLKVKLSKLSKLSKSLIEPYIEANRKMDSSNSSNSFQKENDEIEYVKIQDFEKKEDSDDS